MHLVGFIMRVYHDARSPERHISSITYCYFSAACFGHFQYSQCTNNYTESTINPLDVKTWFSVTKLMSVKHQIYKFTFLLEYSKMVGARCGAVG